MRFAKVVAAVGIAGWCLFAVSDSVRAEDDRSTAGPAQPQELGAIRWRRGFDAAMAESKRSDTPLLVLFQEVPGCSTCKSYGDVVLSHPLIRDAVESLFVPVAIYNNSPGDDARVLKRFREPAWNNPVVRIMRHDGTELASRVAGDYSRNGLVAAMVTALEKEKREVPMYLRLLHEELTARDRGLERATFAMHCFWDGEAQLGGLDGVIATMPGFLRNKEVVDVWFDPGRIAFSTLVSRARRMQCAGTVFARSASQEKSGKSMEGLPLVRAADETRPDREPKYLMSKTLYRFVPMTATQAARVNSTIREGGDPNALLSPGQLRLFSSVKAHPEAGWKDAVGAEDFVKAFEAAERVAAKAAR